MFIERVTRSLQQHGAIFAVLGGYAVALHGALDLADIAALRNLP
jgi:hypothetical protein